MLGSEKKFPIVPNMKTKKPYTIFLGDTGGWWSAICPELQVSGLGESKADAIASITVSIRSRLSILALALKNPDNIKKVLRIIRDR
jgi:hypothetical protein